MTVAEELESLKRERNALAEIIAETNELLRLERTVVSVLIAAGAAGENDVNAIREIVTGMHKRWQRK